MRDDSNDLERRTVLLSAAGFTLAGRIAVGTLPTGTRLEAATPIPAGKPGEFDFLEGRWRIRHRMRKGAAWDEFSGEATCWSILGGVGSIEELRIPARDFSGLGLRLLDVEKRVWSDFWVNAKSGVLVSPGVTGGFQDGVGLFLADDVDGDRPIKVRGVWDHITRTSHRWRQGLSRDGGKTWDESWLMEWSRVA